MDPSQGRVAIDVSVTDALGRAVSGLKEGDFKLLDEGQPLVLASFAASTATGPAPDDPPVSVVLVLDDADLLPANHPEAQSDLEKFLRANGGWLAQTVTVYRVTADKLYAAGPSQDGDALADQIATGMNMRTVWKPERTAIVRGPANEAEIYSAPVSDPTLPHFDVVPERETIALKALGAITVEQRRLPGRKLLFWIGPGWRVDLTPEVVKSAAPMDKIFNSITEFSTRLREARIELSVANRWLGREAGRSILTQSEVDRYVGGAHIVGLQPYYNLALQVLAIRSGGEVLTTNDELIATAQPDRNDIPRLIAEHIAKASNYYRLTFDPLETSTVDEYHRLNVVLARPGLTARCVTGYYDEPVLYDQPMPATDQVTVARLEQMLAGKHSDRELADELRGPQLTERLSTPRLQEWLMRMPGQRSREALTAIADVSVLLPPPADELISMPAPDLAAQKAMLSRVADYLAREVPRLPNFYAQRTTVQFGEPVPKKDQTWKTAQPDRNLYYERTTTEHIYFEDGKETVDRQKVRVKQSPQDLLRTTGTFGPILVLVLKAAASPGGLLTWSHWEKGPAGPLAVYHYVSSPNMRDYEVGFCCLAVDQGMYPFNRMVTFRGEFAIDPSTGHILRLTVKADLEPRLPLKISAVIVEYGPVEMGAQTYFCPLRSVSISRQRRVWAIDEWDMQFKIYGPFKTVLNDVTFSSYHLFRAQTTILPGFVPVPQSQ